MVQAIDNHNVAMLNIYIDNSREIYNVTEWLRNSIVKKMKKNEAVTVERLAKCSTMVRITRQAAEMVKEYDGVTVTMEERRTAARKHAQSIIDDAAYLARC